MHSHAKKKKNKGEDLDRMRGGDSTTKTEGRLKTRPVRAKSELLEEGGGRWKGKRPFNPF